MQKATLQSLQIADLLVSARPGEQLESHDVGHTDGRVLRRQKGHGLVLVEPDIGRGCGCSSCRRPCSSDCRVTGAGRPQRLAAGLDWQELDIVFAQPDGRPIGAPTDWKAWKALLSAAGVPAARLQDARHTAATLLLQQGVAPRVAMQLLGHSQNSMTMHDTHVVPELATDAAVRMDAALWVATDQPLGNRAQERHKRRAADLSSHLSAQVRHGAAYRNRTDDNLITSEVLYRLS